MSLLQSNSKREEIQEKALDIAKSYKRVGLAISMGVGKTYIGLKHMDWYLKKVNSDAKFLVVAPKKTIFSSWFDDMDKFGMTHLKDRVVVTTYLSLHKQSLNYDVIYLDECHSLLHSHQLWLTAYDNIIVGLTGTPPRNYYSEKGEMVAKFCPIMFTYFTDDAVDDKILNDYRITVHPVNLSRLKTYEVNVKGKSWNTSESDNYAYWCKRLNESTSASQEQFNRIGRMRAIMDYRSKEEYAKKLLTTIEGKCIIFCNTQDQADRMCNYVYYSGHPFSEDNLDMFKKGQIDQLACVLQLNEGVNIPNLKHAIILHSYGNERKSAQRIGRVLRLNPDEVADVHILMYHETVDKRWVQSALVDFDQRKIKYKLANVYNH
jgi:superfamily II DNA or RNA helicase